MRKESLIDELEKRLSTVALSERLKTEITPVVLEKSVKNNLEVIYQIATGRLASLAYNIAWAATLNNDIFLKPKDAAIASGRGVPITFHDFGTISPEAAATYNTSFSVWILSLTVRELSEFLNYYLLGLYETCLVAKYANKRLKPFDVVEMRSEYNSFEESGLKDRLKILRAKFEIEVSHTQELSSLYNLRNLFAHFDGVVQSKFCDPNGEMRINWPVNRYKLKERDGEKKESYHRASKPFNSDLYGSVQITWLDNSREIIYKAGERVTLAPEDLNDLIFFYLYVFNQLQKTLVNYVRTSGIKAKYFEKYVLKPTFFAIVDNGEKIKLKLN